MMKDGLFCDSVKRGKAKQGKKHVVRFLRAHIYHLFVRCLHSDLEPAPTIAGDVVGYGNNNGHTLLRALQTDRFKPTADRRPIGPFQPKSMVCCCLWPLLLLLTLFTVDVCHTVTGNADRNTNLASYRQDRLSLTSTRSS